MYKERWLHGWPPRAGPLEQAASSSTSSVQPCQLCFHLCTTSEAMDAQLTEKEAEASPNEFHGTSHWRSMALDTLRPDEAYKMFEKLKTRYGCRRNIAHPCSLTTDGIELAKPASLYRFLNRGPYKISSLSKSCDDFNHPRPWIPAHVNRTFNNLSVDDIKGTRSNPKNMKLGNAARGTNPLDPVYKLPSCKDIPHFEPKFLRDNLNVDDILGAQPKKRVRFFTDAVRSGEVIEGSFPGWRPFHRRRFGKAVRDLCLQVHDINKPVRRMVRNGNSEAYLEIEGTHPKHLKQFDGDGVRHNHSLQDDDIKTMLDERRCKEVTDIFKQLDRDKSGKLTIQEVRKTLRKLEIDLNATELMTLSKSFDSDLDGFVDYQKLLRVSACCENKKHRKSDHLDSRVVALSLNQWIDRPWPGASVKSNERVGLQCEQKFKCLDATTAAEPEVTDTVKTAESVNKTSGPENCSVEVDSREIERTNQMDIFCSLDRSNDTKGSPTCSPQRLEYKLPLPLGGPFWPDEKNLQAQYATGLYFSLPQDYKEPPQSLIRPLSDDEKTWEKKVGGALFTGEGNVVSHGSYMTGYDWSRPSTARLQTRKGRPQSLPDFCFLPDLDMQCQLLSTSRSENYSTSLKSCTTPKDQRRPMSASMAQNGQRPVSASMHCAKGTRFSSPRSVLTSPASSRSSWSPRSGFFGLESTPRTRDLLGGSISARESLANKSHAEKVAHKLQSLRKADAAAVRALF